MENIKNIINKFEPSKSILAGMFIGIGGLAYLSVTTSFLGALLFSIGLLVILTQGYYLYTGKIGFANSSNDFKFCFRVLLWNAIGAIFTALVSHELIYEEALKVVSKKLCLPIDIAFIRAILCGILIHIAVQLYQKTENYLTVIIPIMLFVLCGFEHSIANIFYFTAANVYSIKALIYILIYILGNSLGALFVALLDNPKK